MLAQPGADVASAKDDANASHRQTAWQRGADFRRPGLLARWEAASTHGGFPWVRTASRCTGPWGRGARPRIAARPRYPRKWHGTGPGRCAMSAHGDRGVGW